MTRRKGESLEDFRARQRVARRRYEATEKGHAVGRAAKRRYAATEKGRAAQHRYNASVKGYVRTCRSNTNQRKRELQNVNA